MKCLKLLLNFSLKLLTRKVRAILIDSYFDLQFLRFDRTGDREAFTVFQTLWTDRSRFSNIVQGINGVVNWFNTHKICFN